jgi:hypothetical protein
VSSAGLEIVLGFIGFEVKGRTKCEVITEFEENPLEERLAQHEDNAMDLPVGLGFAIAQSLVRPPALVVRE